MNRNILACNLVSRSPDLSQYKLSTPIAQFGQCTSDQVGKGLMNMNKHELLRVVRIH